MLFVALGVAFASAKAQSYFEFDFQHDEYTDCFSGKDPCFYPVGWSKDGKFMYKERYCDGTGCSGGAIIVRDLMTNTDAKYEYIDERLTTFEAREILKDNKSDVVDANAAKILIDNWFNINK